MFFILESVSLIKSIYDQYNRKYIQDYHMQKEKK